jgi:hypothetical protein
VAEKRAREMEREAGEHYRDFVRQRQLTDSLKQRVRTELQAADASSHSEDATWKTTYIGCFKRMAIHGIPQWPDPRKCSCNRPKTAGSGRS